MTLNFDRRHFLGLAGMTASAAALAACGGPTTGGNTTANEAAEIDFGGVKLAGQAGLLHQLLTGLLDICRWVIAAYLIK